MSTRLCVVVEENGPCNFTWMLVTQQSSSSRSRSVVNSTGRFADYDQALDAGFEALRTMTNWPAPLGSIKAIDVP